MYNLSGITSVRINMTILIYHQELLLRYHKNMKLLAVNVPFKHRYRNIQCVPSAEERILIKVNSKLLQKDTTQFLSNSEIVTYNTQREVTKKQNTLPKRGNHWNNRTTWRRKYNNVREKKAWIFSFGSAEIKIAYSYLAVVIRLQPSVLNSEHNVDFFFWWCKSSG